MMLCDMIVTLHSDEAMNVDECLDVRQGKSRQRDMNLYKNMIIGCCTCSW